MINTCNTIQHKQCHFSLIQILEGEDLPMKTVHLLTLMRNVLKTAGDFWSRYQCDEMFDIKYVTVDSEYARKNILTEMLQRSLCLAHILGLKVSKTLRISFTQYIIISLAYHMI